MDNKERMFFFELLEFGGLKDKTIEKVKEAMNLLDTVDFKNESEMKKQNQMTVGELIEHLEGRDFDSEVVIQHDQEGWYSLDFVKDVVIGKDEACVSLNWIE